MSYHQARWARGDRLEPLVFELSSKDRKGIRLPQKLPARPEIPDELIRDSLELPELSEPEVVRHYTRLSQMNYGVDLVFYPIGSCTMKYNPKICDELAASEEAAFIHPDQDEDTVQGALELMYRLEHFLSEIGGVSRVCLHPSAGAHGELLGMLLTRAYHSSRGEDRSDVIIPDSAHGTNFASGAMAGFHVVIIPSNNRGRVDLEALKAAVSDRTAALMLTNPNTLGLFEDEILEIAEVVHEAGGLLYYDGANMNGVLGKVRPG
ncbi:MAG: aminomethyl-transferring glycine dehydrogenase subunit GcvPB, partial [Hadesarchaea archaeon]